MGDDREDGAEGCGDEECGFGVFEELFELWEEDGEEEDGEDGDLEEDECWGRGVWAVVFVFEGWGDESSPEFDEVGEEEECWDGAEEGDEGAGESVWEVGEEGADSWNLGGLVG